MVLVRGFALLDGGNGTVGASKQFVFDVVLSRCCRTRKSDSCLHVARVPMCAARSAQTKSNILCNTHPSRCSAPSISPSVVHIIIFVPAVSTAHAGVSLGCVLA